MQLSANQWKPVEIKAIWGLTVDRRRYLHAFYQLNIMNGSGRMVTQPNNPLYWTWDSISVNVFDENGRFQGRYGLSDYWQWRMVGFVGDNHLFPLNL